MKPTRVRELVLVVITVGLITWIVVGRVYADLPELQWFVPLSLPLLGALEVMLGWELRARIQHRRGARLVEPIAAARAVALAKASAIVGAAMLGVWSGVLGYVVPRRDTLVAARDDSAVAFVGAGGALVLIAAALWLEYCCRAPKPPEDSDSGRSPVP